MSRRASSAEEGVARRARLGARPTRGPELEEDARERRAAHARARTAPRRARADRPRPRACGARPRGRRSRRAVSPPACAAGARTRLVPIESASASSSRDAARAASTRPAATAARTSSESTATRSSRRPSSVARSSRSASASAVAVSSSSRASSTLPDARRPRGLGPGEERASLVEAALTTAQLAELGRAVDEQRRAPPAAEHGERRLELGLGLVPRARLQEHRGVLRAADVEERLQLPALRELPAPARTTAFARSTSPTRSQAAIRLQQTLPTHIRSLTSPAVAATADSSSCRMPSSTQALVHEGQPLERPADDLHVLAPELAGDRDRAPGGCAGDRRLAAMPARPRPRAPRATPARGRAARPRAGEPARSSQPRGHRGPSAEEHGVPRERARRRAPRRGGRRAPGRGGRHARARRSSRRRRRATSARCPHTSSASGSSSAPLQQRERLLPRAAREGLPPCVVHPGHGGSIAPP